MGFWEKYKLYLRIRHGQALVHKINREVLRAVLSAPDSAHPIGPRGAAHLAALAARERVLVAELGRLRAEYKKIKFWSWKL